MTKRLRSLGVSIHFVEGNYDLDIPENFLAYIIGISIPQVENERKALNTIQGMRQALRQGYWVWKAPKGYKNDSVDKIIKKNSDAIFIKKAFENVGTGFKSTEKIRKELNKEGFKCCKQQFLNLLRNPIYTGRILIKEWKNEPLEFVKALHEPIIDIELFERVQFILNQKGKNFPKPSKFNDLFPLRV